MMTTLMMITLLLAELLPPCICTYIDDEDDASDSDFDPDA
jgi:hypothetical protein